MPVSRLRSERLARAVFMLVSLGVVLLGVQGLLKGDLFYPNYWGGSVFGPVAITIGLLGLYLGVFRWHKLAAPPERLKGRAARRARRAERRAPIEDFDKPWTGGV